jgi:hypothetical protein
MTKIFTLIIFIMGLIILMLPLKALGQDFITDDDFSLKTKKGIAVIEFWAEWNSNNQVNFLPNLSDCNPYRVCIVKNSMLKSKYNIISIPTVVVLNNGVEEKRFLPNIMFQLDASKKKVQGVIDEIILERFQ